MGTFADALSTALRRAEACGRDGSRDTRGAVASAMVDIDAGVAAAIAAAGDDRPGWARTLGVAETCSADDLRRAYRRRVFETHPDRGGSHEALLAVRRAFDEALAARTRRPAPPRSPRARATAAAYEARA